MQLLSCRLGLFLLRLSLLDVAYGLLYLPACTLDYLLRLLPCLRENFFLLLLDVFQLLEVAFRDSGQRLVAVLHLLELLVQGTPVAGDSPEVALYADELFTRPVLGILDYFLREFHLARELEGEGIAREAYFQLEHRLDAGRVIEHGTVGDVGVGTGSIELEVGVVGGNHPVHTPAVYFAEYRLGYRAAGGRFGAGTEFVYQHQGLFIGAAQHIAHLREEGTVGAEVVLDVLVVSYAHHYPVEDRELRGLGCGDEHTPLEHILEQAGGLQADRLAPGVRSGYEEYALLVAQAYCQRNHIAPFGLECLFQKRMPRLAQGQAAVTGDHRHPGYHIKGGLRLRHQEIDFSEQLRPGYEFGEVRAEELAEIVEDSLNLASFLETQAADLVLELDYFRRLDEACLSGGGLVIDKALKLALGG